MKKVLAVDMGATSIRGILGYMEDGKLVLKEVMRFAHKMTEYKDRLRWDMDGLMKHIIGAIAENKDEIVSVGIDTWGVDFGLLDKEGNLLDRPICYRDSYNIKGYDEAVKVLSEKEIFNETGTQIMSINTLFQLLAYRSMNKDKFKEIYKIILMPDLIQYLLTNKIVGEETIWSTTQILNLETGEYSQKILEAFQIPKDILPEIVKPGDITGSLKDSKIEELKGLDIDVISVCGHDTASAVLLTDAMIDEDTMFLSCGTWSLFGVKREKPDLSDKAYSYNMTNELGFESTPLFFKNITGLFLLEKYKSQYEEVLGRKLRFEEITEYVQESYKNMPTLESLIDMEDARFGSEEVVAKQAIDDYLIEHGKPIPESEMDYFRVIYESLAQKYLETKQSLEKITNKTYHKVHMIGGGAKSKLLCQLIADKLKVDVKAGPFEASALGNILIQLKNAGEITDIKEGIRLAFASEETYHYKYNK